MTFFAAFFFITAGAVTKSTVMIGLGVVMIVVTFVLITIFAGKQNRTASGGKSVVTRVNASQFHKYMPLLADERTKQHPEVQRLLQYTEVQRVFFDPGSLSSSATANDEHVRELFAVFDEMLAQAAINGTVYGTQSGAAPMAAPMQMTNPEKPPSTPRRTLGTILYFGGLAMFFLPFFSLFFMAMGSGTSTPAIKAMSFIMTGCAPIGMILIVIGRIIKK